MLSEVLLLVGEAVVLDFPSDWKNELKRGRRLLLQPYILLILLLQMPYINATFSLFPQFFSKLEEKFQEKEAEKTNLQEKSKVSARTT